jgi:pimeloyl-ACP methyl ester carboxylesterase
VRFVVDSGRRVAVHRLTRGTDRCVVVLCHGAPGSGCFDPDPAETRARNVRLLGVDRPGYGRSQPVAAEWPTVASAADDVAAVLDNLDVERVGVAGWSLGGRVALALAARHPDLVDRVVTLGTPAPDAAVPWIEPQELDGLRRAPEQARARLRTRLDSIIPADPHSSAALRALGASAADDAALQTPGARRRLGEMLEAAFMQGSSGLAADIAAHSLRPWGFEPEAVRAETLLLYGSRDPLVGPQDGLWWRAHLPNARLEVFPRAGSLLVIPTWRRVLSHLVPDRTPLRLVEGGRSELDAAGVEEFSAA